MKKTNVVKSEPIICELFVHNQYMLTRQFLWSQFQRARLLRDILRKVEQNYWPQELHQSILDELIPLLIEGNGDKANKKFAELNDKRLILKYGEKKQ